MDVVIGVDPSSRAMHAVVTSEDSGPEAHYQILHKDKTVANAQAFTWIQRIVKQQGMADVYVFVELPVMGRAGAHTMLAIGKAIGAVEAGASLAGAKVVEVNNMTWKSKVIGGKVGKPEINRFVKKFDLPFWEKVDGQQDTCDAYCINLYGQKVLNISKKPALGKKRVVKRRSK